MATEREFELLDNYLANRLSGEEKSAFEKSMQADSALQGELEFQQHLIKGIKQVRIAELKTMLNNVPVPPPIAQGGTATIVKIAAGTFVAGLVATGIYFYAQKQEANNLTEEVIDAEVKQRDEQIKTTPLHQTQEIPVDKKVETPSGVSSAKEEKLSEKTNQSTQEKESVSQQPVLDVFDPSSDSESNSVNRKEKNGESELSGKNEPSIAVEIDRLSKKYTFHYQFRDDKLFLYGPFEKNLYEIMEFFSDEKRTVFLYYKDGYYLLKEDSVKIKMLSPIADPNLLQKLKEYRAN